MEGWKTDSVFKPYYHGTGRVSGLVESPAERSQVTGASTPQQVQALRSAYEAAVAHGCGSTHEWLENEEDIVRRAPHLAGTNIKVRTMS